MKEFSKLFLFLTFSVCFIVLLDGCKEKGCTDPNAINYNSVADEDDGSCILCQGTVDTITSNTVDLIDNGFSSIHYGDVVGTFFVTQIQNKFKYSECGSNNCNILVSFQSFMDSTMDFQFNLRCNNNIFFNWNKFVSIPSVQKVYLGAVPNASITNPCIPILGSSLSSYSSNIIYH